MRNVMLFVLSLPVILISCNNGDGEIDFTNAQDVSITLVPVCEALPMILNVKEHLTEGDSLIYNCSLQYVTGDTASFPAQNGPVEYKFAYDTACTEHDGRIRKGSIRLIYYDNTNEYDYALIFDDLEIYGYLYNGSVVITENTDDPNSDYDVKSYMLELQRNSASASLKIDAEATRIQQNIISYVFDKKDGTGTNEVEFVYESAGLEWNMACHQIEKGFLYVKPEKDSWRTVDFGDGNCNNKVKASVFNTSLTFTLP